MWFHLRSFLNSCRSHFLSYLVLFSFYLLKFVWFLEKNKKKLSSEHFISNEKKHMKRMWLLFVCTNICMSKKLFAIAKITDWFSRNKFQFTVWYYWADWLIPKISMLSIFLFHIFREWGLCVCWTNSNLSLSLFFFWVAKHTKL